MTGEQLRRHGLVQAAMGVALVAWVVVVAAVVEVGTPHALVAVAVSAGLVCLCPVAGGLVASRVTDAASATRLRHVFVVVEAAALSIAYPAWWTVSSTDPAGRTGDLTLEVLLLVAVIVALVLTVRLSRTVHKVVVDVHGPLVQGSGDGAPAQRIRVLGAVLVVAGAGLTAGVVAVSLTAPRYQGLYLFSGLLMTLATVLLGASLARVTDVYSARRKNVGLYLVTTAASALPLAAFGFENASAVLLAALEFGAVVSMVAALVMVREFTGEWDRPWRERRRAGR